MLVDQNPPTGGGGGGISSGSTTPRFQSIGSDRDDLTSYCPSVISVGREMHAIKKGLLWQQRERLFSRWKERYFILTKDYLHCFKRSSGVHNISPMGQFIFKVKLVELEKVEWLNKKSYNAIGLTLQGRESRVLLRCSSGLEEWFDILEECTIASKERRVALRKLHDPNWEPSLDGGFYSHTSWLDSTDSNITDTSSFRDAILKRRSKCGPDFDVWTRSSRNENRLSLLTDIDINSWDSTPPDSAASTCRGRPYRFNTDVFFMPHSNNANTSLISNGRSVVTPVPSFRTNNMYQPPPSQQPRTRHRERSQSDALNKIRPPNAQNKRASYVSTALSHY